MLATRTAYIGSTTSADLTPDTIVAAVADTFGVTPQILTGPSRTPEMIDARKVAIRLLARHGLGPTAIGHIVGRHHSTVHHHQQTRLSDEQRTVLTDLARELRLPAQRRQRKEEGCSGHR